METYEPLVTLMFWPLAINAPACQIAWYRATWVSSFYPFIAHNSRDNLVWLGEDSVSFLHLVHK